MKKLLAGLLFTALLAPDSALATYSCYGTRSPCPFSSINASPLAEKPLKPEKVKKTKKKAKKKQTKKAVAKKKAPAKVYCEPAPTDAKAGAVVPAPAATMTPEATIAPVAVPAPIEAVPAPAPVPVPSPEPVKTPELEKVVPSPIDTDSIKPKSDVEPQPVPEKKSDAAPEPSKDGSVLDTLNALDAGKTGGGFPPANAVPDLKPLDAAPKPVPDTGFPEINAPSVPSAPEPPALQAPTPTGTAPVEAMPTGPMKP